MGSATRRTARKPAWKKVPQLPRTNAPPSAAHVDAKARAAEALATYRNRANPEPDFVTLTAAMIHAARVGSGGWNREQLATLGVPWPPPSGWIKQLVGRSVVAAEYRRFVALKGAKKRKSR